MQYSASRLIVILLVFTITGEVAAQSGGSRRFVHPQFGYAITPPAGFKLRQVGRRTIWQEPGGAQILVETGASTGSPRRSWERLNSALAKKYGSRYRLLRIRDVRLAGRAAAVWEFDIGDIRKADVGLSSRGRGYAILVSAPRSRFLAWKPQFEAVLRSFTLPRTTAHSVAPRRAKLPMRKPPMSRPSPRRTSASTHTAPGY